MDPTWECVSLRRNLLQTCVWANRWNYWHLSGAGWMFFRCTWDFQYHEYGWRHQVRRRWCSLDLDKTWFLWPSPYGWASQDTERLDRAFWKRLALVSTEQQPQSSNQLPCFCLAFFSLPFSFANPCWIQTPQLVRTLLQYTTCDSCLRFGIQACIDTNANLFLWSRTYDKYRDRLRPVKSRACPRYSLEATHSIPCKEGYRQALQFSNRGVGNWCLTNHRMRSFY